MTTETIDHGTLSRLVEAGAVKGAHVVGQGGGWAILVKYGLHERPLATRGREVRHFRKLETLVSYLKRIGIARFDVDAASYDPAEAPKNARPDRSEALKHAHEAAAYDAWLRDKVAASLADPRPSIPHEEAMRRVRAVIDAKRQQHERRREQAAS